MIDIGAFEKLVGNKRKQKVESKRSYSNWDFFSQSESFQQYWDDWLQKIFSNVCWQNFDYPSGKCDMHKIIRPIKGRFTDCLLFVYIIKKER